MREDKFLLWAISGGLAVLIEQLIVTNPAVSVVAFAVAAFCGLMALLVLLGG